MSDTHKKHQDAHKFLKSHPVGVLATVDPDGNPHAATIYFAVDNSLVVSFLTKTGTKKADNLEHNNHAQLVVYEATTQTTVQLTGEVSQVKDHAEFNEIFAQILNASIDTSGTSVPPISKLKEGDYVVYRLKPKEVRMATYGNSKAGEYEDMFKTIVPNAG